MTKKQQPNKNTTVLQPIQKDLHVNCDICLVIGELVNLLGKHEAIYFFVI